MANNPKPIGESWSFEEVLKLFESEGYELYPVVSDDYKPEGWKVDWSEQRIFRHPDDPSAWPFTIPVKNRKVDIYYVEKIQQYFKERKRFHDEGDGKDGAKPSSR